jgi:hypothetical protein
MNDRSIGYIAISDVWLRKTDRELPRLRALFALDRDASEAIASAPFTLHRRCIAPGATRLMPPQHSAGFICLFMLARQAYSGAAAKVRGAYRRTAYRRRFQDAAVRRALKPLPCEVTPASRARAAAPARWPRRPSRPLFLNTGQSQGTPPPCHASYEDGGTRQVCSGRRTFSRATVSKQPRRYLIDPCGDLRALGLTPSAVQSAPRVRAVVRR